MEESSVSLGVPIFTSRELAEATNNFSASIELGRRDFGTVYYGMKMLIHSSQQVMIAYLERRLLHIFHRKTSGRARSSSQLLLQERSYRSVDQFMDKAEILGRLHRKNVVLLYSRTRRHSWELLLVYE